MVFKDLLPLLRTFPHCTRATPRKRVVSCCISSRQQLDCWGSAILELPAVGVPELRRVCLRERGESAAAEGKHE